MREINGEDTLRFSLPFADAKRAYIANEARIQIVDDIYRIRSVTDEKTSDGKSTTTVYAGRSSMTWDFPCISR